jgi:pimeloyl-ACP methyl ester carboxylesterase
VQYFHIDGVDLEYQIQGSGESLVLIHGSILADAFSPLLSEPSIANRYRVISYHRRGFAASSRAMPGLTIRQQATDCHALIHHLQIPRAHVAGHSSGGAIALQWALDAPEDIHSLALLEPALVNSVPSSSLFWDWVASVRQNTYEHRDKIGAVDAFLTGVVGANYHPILNEHLPPGAFNLAVADVDTFFEVEAPALREWCFAPKDAESIKQPMLSVLGADSAPIFHEVHQFIKKWMPHSHELIVPNTTHALQYMNPRGIAEDLARFLERHPF